MGGKGSGVLSQTGKVRQLDKVLKLSEQKIIQVLEGKTNLPERVILNTALEIYKRRVPAKTEKAEEVGNKLTLIKVVKNFTPEGGGTTVVDMDAQIDAIEDLSRKKAEEFFDDPIAAEFGDSAVKEEDKPIKAKVLKGDFDE